MYSTSQYALNIQTDLGIPWPHYEFPQPSSLAAHLPPLGKNFVPVRELLVLLTAETSFAAAAAAAAAVATAQ